MTDNKKIDMPEKTQQRVIMLSQQQETITRMIESAVMAVRDALEVPEDWELMQDGSGFVPPDPEASQ